MRLSFPIARLAFLRLSSSCFALRGRVTSLCESLTKNMDESGTCTGFSSGPNHSLDRSRWANLIS